VTGTPATRLLLASRTSAVIVAFCEPSEGICGWLVMTLIVCCPPPAAATVTVVLPDTVPALAVTTIAVALATPDAVSEVVTCPVALVVAVLVERVPAVVENVTVAFETAVPLELVTTAVIVALAEPSPGMVAVVLLTATVAGVPVWVGVPVPHWDVVLPVPEVRLPQPLSPPHPARASSVNPNRTIIDAILRMFPYLKTGCRGGSCRINTR
jgi:hypothetical protein